MSLEIHQEECRNDKLAKGCPWRFTRKNVETINELNDVLGDSPGRM